MSLRSSVFVQKKIFELGTALAFLLSATLCGCGAEGEESTSGPGNAPAAGGALTFEDQSKVLASYDGADGRQLQVVELEPGVVLIAQAGRIGEPNLLSPEQMSKLTPKEAYERVSGAEAPASLARLDVPSGLQGLSNSDALASADDEALPLPPASSREDERASDIGVATQALADDSYFWGIYCKNPNDSHYRFKQCRNCTGQRDFQIDEAVGDSQAALMNLDDSGDLTGSLKIRPGQTWSPATGYTVKPGKYSTFWFSMTRRNPDVKMYVNGTGKNYSGCIRAQVTYY